MARAAQLTSSLSPNLGGVVPSAEETEQVPSWLKRRGSAGPLTESAQATDPPDLAGPTRKSSGERGVSRQTRRRGQRPWFHFSPPWQGAIVRIPWSHCGLAGLGVVGRRGGEVSAGWRLRPPRRSADSSRRRNSCRPSSGVWGAGGLGRWHLGRWRAGALAGWGRGHQHCFGSVCADSRVLWKVVLAFVQVRTHNLRLNRLCWQF